MRRATLAAACTLFMLVCAQSGQAQGPLPPPEATDPVALGLMQGAPPPRDRRITLATVLRYPNARWAFHHMRELAATAAVHRGDGKAAPLRPAPRQPGGPHLEKVTFDAGAAGIISLADWQQATYTDALLVLHRGQVALERYHVGMQPDQPHALWSMSKSFVGLLATQLIAEGRLDPAAKVPAYLPELAGTAWAEASLQQVLDMTTAADYDEVFTDPKSAIFRYLFATGLVPAPPGYDGPLSLDAFLPTIREDGPHGEAFAYKSVDTEVLGWILHRVTGMPVSELLQTRIWQQMGAQDDAYYLLDPAGTRIASIGLNATLRDLARFGEMLRQEGRFNGRQVLPAAVVREIRKGADPERFRAAGQAARDGYSYHNQWWIPHDADGSFEAKGLNGQHLHVNPAAELVIVKLSSHPVGGTLFTHALDRAAFAAIAAAVRR
ncbi:MAG: serine hydrolase [Sneathiellaceae bacterium]